MDGTITADDLEMSYSTEADHLSASAFERSFCTTPLFIPVERNSTIWSAISPCLRLVGAPFVPSVILAPICTLILLAYSRLYRKETVRLAPTGLLYAKLTITLFHFIVSILQLLFAFLLLSSSQFREYHKEIQVNSVINFVFALSSLISYGLCIHAGCISNGLLHLFWLLKLIAMIPEGLIIYQYIVIEGSLKLWDSYSLLFLGYFLCSIMMVILLCRADTNSRRYEILTTKEVCPEWNSSALSVMLYWYASPLIFKGLNCTIGFDELWALARHNQADYLRDRFAATGERWSEKSKTKLLVFFIRLMSTTWESLIVACAIVPFAALFRFGGSIFLWSIVNSVENSKPLWFSITALVCMFAIDFLNKTLYARRDVMSFISYCNIRLTLITAIFNKMLRLSAAAKSRYSAGEVLNIVTTDVQRVRIFWFQLRDFIYCPLMIAAALVGLFFVLGINTIYGIIVLLIILPINFYLSKRTAEYEELQMKYKDARLKLVNDILSGIKVLKLYAWEISMQKMVDDLREKELKALRIIFILDGFISTSFQLGPVIASFVSFLGYTVIQGHKLRPEVAFVSMMFFTMLRFAIYQMPQILTYAIKAFVSGKRILKFLNEDEQKPSHICRDDATKPFAVELKNCSFTWDDSKGEAVTCHLADITLNVRQGELVGVVGRVGSGKSSLLAAILGEMEPVMAQNSKCDVYAKSIGYVPQQPWIQNKTLRGNVTFEKIHHEDYYQKTIEACALVDDLKLFAAGDLTEIGEKGINLSGGQKARVSLARAVYQQSDLYVLDDVLSAVDSHVGTHIFNHVIGANGLLGRTTRIFALNSLAFLKDCDRIVVMHEGRIHEIGTLEQLLKKKEGPFADLMREYLEKQVERQKSQLLDGDIGEDIELSEVLKELSFSQRNSEDLPKMERMMSSSIESHSPPKQLSGILSTSLTRRQMSSRSSNRQISHSSHDSAHQAHSEQSNAAQTAQQQSLANAGRLVDEEELATGIVSRKVYVDYTKAFGVFMAIGFAVTMAGSSLFEALANVWLAKWSSEAQQLPDNSTDTSHTTWNLAVYGGFGLLDSICVAVSSIFLAIGAFNASRKFHDRLVFSLFRSPMAFFDRTPLGRIINRLSNDIDRVDENIPGCIGFTFILLASALNSLIAILFVIPGLIVVMVPMFLIFFFLVHFYNRASVQFRRLTSKSWSTVCSFVQDAYIGADSIRVYNVMEVFRERVCKIADFASESVFIEVIVNRWIQIRMDLLTDVASFLFMLAAIILGDHRMISLGAVAMVINSGISFTGFLGEIARMWRECEVSIVGVERINEYIANEHEAEWKLPTRDILPHNWPSAGRIVFDKFCLRYRPTSELVLRELSFEVNSGEKVGIVGRTGAGKTSLTLALFRIVEPCSGTILIDSVDTTSIGLHDLRQALTIIPQDPVLFCGTLRSNLDPFNEFSDDLVWSAIERAYLKDFVMGFENHLSYEISESGNNLSVGQRQLVCLARALLRIRSTKILVLDEATASIDPETDRLIQLSIRENFNNCTILTIAHRLNTVLDYDKILVMDAGRVAEFDSPRTLLANQESQFSSLARHAGIQNEHAVVNGVS
ncbi:ABC transporter transmembrane region domain-containing protein [Ditylenchus destructor]|uniref:ABC transporter transmembrane region domain-containing protein n=1 Tax=Ditylenchus destructor TaxID=166010 RepID=A0AAD4R170_9BILA|nr:ABC transporter transmembrane region domain-containing protein [Ditylenchus destructor]